MSLEEWEAIRAQCMQNGEILKILKQNAPPLPTYFHESDLGLSKGAIRQFRDDCPTNSLHIHEFPDYFLAHVDTFNPEFHPIAHGVVDTPGITLATITGVATAFFVAKIVQNMSFLPSDQKDGPDFW